MKLENFEFRQKPELKKAGHVGQKPTLRFYQVWQCQLVMNNCEIITSETSLT